MAFLFIALMCLPYLLALPLVDFHLIFDYDEFFWALKNSLIQALGSGILATFLGILGALSLTPQSRILRLLLLLPGILPTLFLIISLLSLSPQFPMGLPGIIIAHSIMAFGVISISLEKSFHEHLGRYAEVALTLGVRKLSFLKQIAFPLLKQDLFNSFLFVFASSFTSFTIPLFFSGTTSSTLEILIYEKMRSSQNWSYPFLLSIIQSVLLYFFLFRKKEAKHPFKEFRGVNKRRIDLLQFKSLRIFFYLTVTLFLLVYLRSIVFGLRDSSTMMTLLPELGMPILFTLMIGVGTGILCSCLFVILLTILPNPLLEKFLRGFIAPSSAIACFGFLIWGSNEQFLLIFKLILLLSLLFFASLFRLGFHDRFVSLLRQIDVAKTLGAPRILIFQNIVLPQMLERILFTSGVAGTWAAGEFAISKVLAGQDFTLALQIRSLMTSYRIELAGALSFILILLCLIIFSLFYGASRVLDSKS